MDFLEDKKEPFGIFEEWYAKAQTCGLKEPSSVVLATSTSEGRPSARVVLLKGHDERGFCIYTNFESRKAAEVLKNPNVALLFYWMPLSRQVRIEGVAEEVSKAEADAYFATRHPESRLGAWASKQSHPLDSRETLEQRVIEAKKTHGDDPQKPGYWSGFRVVPSYFEFWEEGAFRLHNRRIFKGNAANGWSTTLLYP